jgi:hypothetical protein
MTILANPKDQTHRAPLFAVRGVARNSSRLALALTLYAALTSLSLADSTHNYVQPRKRAPASAMTALAPAESAPDSKKPAAGGPALCLGNAFSEPAWGPAGDLLGYRCVEGGQGGS